MSRDTNIAKWIADLYVQVGCPFYPHGERFSIAIPDYMRIRMALAKEKKNESIP
jgi:hypothetical protein